MATKSGTRCMILELPLEILGMIIDTLDRKQSMIRLCGCCKRLHALVLPRIYRALEIKEWRIRDLEAPPDSLLGKEGQNLEVDHHTAKRQLVQVALCLLRRPDLAAQVQTLRIVPPGETLQVRWTHPFGIGAASTAPYTYRYSEMLSHIRRLLKSVILPEEVLKRLLKEVDSSDDDDSFLGILIAILPNLISLHFTISIGPLPKSSRELWWGHSWASDLLSSAIGTPSKTLLKKLECITIHGNILLGHPPYNANAEQRGLAYDRCLAKAWHSSIQLPMLTDLTLTDIEIPDPVNPLPAGLVVSKQLQRLALAICSYEDPMSSLQELLERCPPLKTLVIFFGQTWTDSRGRMHRQIPPILDATAMIKGVDYKHASSLENLSLDIKIVLGQTYKVVFDSNLQSFTNLRRLHIHVSVVDSSAFLTHPLVEILQALKAPNLEELRIMGLPSSVWDEMTDVSALGISRLPKLKRVVVDQAWSGIPLFSTANMHHFFNLGRPQGVELIVLGVDRTEVQQKGNWNTCIPIRCVSDGLGLCANGPIWVPRHQSPAAM